MRGLRELQREIAARLLLGENVAAWRIRPNGLSPVQRLGIYRNNTRLGLTEALRGVYPVVDRLVGEGFFDALAAAYVRRHPPKSGCLLDYGAEFPSFIAAYPAAASLPYLADVAKLEWLCHEAYHEAAGAILDLAALARVPEHLQGDIRFRLHPSARLLTSAYPVARIWAVNQPGYTSDDAVSLGEGGCRLLVWRPGLAVQPQALGEGDYALLHALAKGDTITAALEQAALAEAGFDLAASLGLWVGRGLFSDFSV